jgi:hypothetical protein
VSILYDGGVPVCQLRVLRNNSTSRRHDDVVLRWTPLWAWWWSCVGLNMRLHRQWYSHGTMPFNTREGGRQREDRCDMTMSSCCCVCVTRVVDEMITLHSIPRLMMSSKFVEHTTHQRRRDEAKICIISTSFELHRTAR